MVQWVRRGDTTRSSLNLYFRESPHCIEIEIQKQQYRNQQPNFGLIINTNFINQY